MAEIKIDRFSQKLAEIRKAARRLSRTVRGRKPGTGFAWRAARKILAAALAVMLPFLLVVKVSVWMHLDHGTPAYIAMLAGGLSMFVLLTVYVMLISWRLSGRWRLSSFVYRAVGVLVAVFCLYSILFISAGNVKSQQVKSTYASLHPLLRLAVSTLVMADADLVVTDAARSREDYARMGIPLNERSLHFRQRTGYVHAVDLRTTGRGEVRNFIVSTYFDLMGFTTIRHVGTADHLHVSLPVPN